jgi:regulator of protease activity HflC (stomatin/prohibitin superfamily)
MSWDTEEERMAYEQRQRELDEKPPPMTRDDPRGSLHEDKAKIRRLVAEVERLRSRYEARVAAQAASDKEVERLRAHLEQEHSSEDSYMALKAEVKRLRAALERIAAWPEDTDAVPDSEDYRYWAGGSGQAAIARAALAEEKE